MTYNKPVRALAAALVVSFLLTVPAAAQLPLFEKPRTSPAASVTQRVGITDITVKYHRPGVKSRRIWGALIPYGEVWRAGANENTTISFSTPVIVGGKQLPAGTYGLHMLIEPSQWTLILSSQSRAWGSFSYDPKEDVVRVVSTPQVVEHQEWLEYSFEYLTDHSVMLSLRWERLQALFRIEIDIHATVVQELRDGLRGLPRFVWRGWYEAAEWCLNNNTNLDEALEWIDQSIALDRNFSNLSVKAGLLQRKGRGTEAQALINEAINTASVSEIDAYGYQLMALGETDRAIEVLKRNVERHPNVWFVYDSLGEAYVRKGDAKKAAENYRKALSMVRDERQQNRIRGILANLE